MLISAKMIARPRIARLCSWCGEPIEGPQLRLYGCAEDGDRPYVAYLHRGCTNDAEVAAKLGEVIIVPAPVVTTCPKRTDAEIDAQAQRRAETEAREAAWDAARDREEEG